MVTELAYRQPFDDGDAGEPLAASCGGADAASTVRRRRRGALVVSLDFELHWGVRDRVSTAAYRDNLLGARAAVPAMLRLFEDHDIHATWATVGLLFFETKHAMLRGLPARRPAYARRELNPYDALADVGANEKQDPFHFAPSLIRQIAATPHQEIGTHTFSHYYCLEDGPTLADFREDLDAADDVACRVLGRAPRSIVFPRNQYTADHLAACRQSGLDVYRGNRDAWPYRPRAGTGEHLVRRGVRLADAYVPLTGTVARPCPPPASAAAPLDVVAARYLRPWSRTLRHLEPLRLRRIEREMTRAARDGRLFHLWWHPHDFGADLEENLAVLRRIFRIFDRLRATDAMTSLTMAEASESGGAR